MAEEKVFDMIGGWLILVALGIIRQSVPFNFTLCGI